MSSIQILIGRAARSSRFGLALAAVAIGMSTATVRAQAPAAEYKELPTTVRGWTKVMHSAEAAQFTQVLLGNADFKPEQLEQFFRSQVLPQFTLIKENVFIESEDPKELPLRHTSRLPKMREEFEKRFVLQTKQEKQQPQFEFLNKITIEVMSQVATENFHPLARYNAAYMLGKIQDYSTNKPAKEALPALIRWLDWIDMVRVAAMMGLQKQIEAGNADADRRKIQDALIKIVLETKPAAGDTIEGGHNWVRRKAIETLVQIGDPGNGQAVLKAFAKVLKDSGSSVELSCAAARALGSFSLRNVNGLEAGPLAASIGQIGLEAVKDELARAADLAAAAPIPVAQRNNNGLAGPLGGAARNPAAPVPAANPFISATWLQSQLQQLQIGIAGVGPGNGVAAAAGAKDAATVADIGAKLKDLIDKANPKAIDYDTLKRDLEKASANLEAAVNKQPAGGRPTTTDAGDQFGDATKAPPAKAGK